MKLNWLRAGCASIAEHGGFSFLCDLIGKGEWVVQVRKDNGDLIEGDTLTGTMSNAEEWHEKWLDQHDKPQWKQSEEWLWSTTWRGVFAYCRKDGANLWNGFYAARPDYWPAIKGTPSAESCMSELEAEIRARTGGAE